MNMATPTPKQTAGATPTYLTSSPRPSGGPMARATSHKSPSARTPSVSGHGHGGHPPGAPFQQYSTPLAAVAAGIEDPVTFSSPSALLALGGYTGISPSPATHDALVASGINDHDIHALGMQGLKLGPARDSDEERRRHIEDVVQLLRTRVAGRGVCREGIERLGQLEGFESIWQEDNLSIAGNFVDLEIEFHPGKNSVKDVSLKYATPEASEGERREEATAVLRRDLIQSPDEIERGSWKTLEGFYENLRWLAKLDRLSQEANCFEAIEGLYESLSRIWSEESKHPKLSGVYEHLCNGWVGRPCLHRGGRVGVSLDYWVDQAKMLDAKQKRISPDAMALDHPDNESDYNQHKMWSVMVECEEGYPSLRVSKDWVNSEALVASNTEEMPTSNNDNASSGIPLVNWSDPPPTMNSENQNNPDAMALDSSMLGSTSTPNRRFVAKIEPPIDVPILAASDIYRHLDLQLPQEFKMVTYDGLLVPGWSSDSSVEAIGFGAESFQPDRRKRRTSVQAYDTEGKGCEKQHSYTFQAFESVAGRTIRDLPFAHPRQLADVLPILRQYASLANLIHKIFVPSSKDRNKNKQHAEKANATKIDEANQEKNGLVILSNQNPNEQKLDALLKGSDLKVNLGGMSDASNDISQDNVNIDITLRTQLGQAPVLMLLFTLNDEDLQNIKLEDDYSSRISISFEVGLNGHISVVDTSGLCDDSPSSNETKGEEQQNDSQQDKKTELQTKIARALEVSQDLGTLVEWVLQQRRA